VADIVGTSARDTLSGTAGADTLSGGDSSDRVFGGAGNDIIYGHSAADADPNAHLIDAVRVASGLSSPLYAASPPGDPNRLFIVEQHTGRIRILDLDTGQLNADAFLDLPDSSLAGGGEQGLVRGAAQVLGISPVAARARLAWTPLFPDLESIVQTAGAMAAVIGVGDRTAARKRGASRRLEREAIERRTQLAGDEVIA